jgi:hypothetical protein
MSFQPMTTTWGNWPSAAYPYNAYQLNPATWPTNAASSAMPISQLVNQLGQVTRRDPDTGLVKFNTPLIQSIVSSPRQALPPLNAFLSQAKQELQIVEGLYTAQQIAHLTQPTEKAQLNGLYATVAKRFNDTNNPLIQTYLAGFYRELNEPSAFGPLLKMLARSGNPSASNKIANLAAGQWKYPDINPAEEIGGALSSLIASQAAEKLYAKFYPGTKTP